jgi:sulfatase modifying factor 1
MWISAMQALMVDKRLLYTALLGVVALLIGGFLFLETQKTTNSELFIDMIDMVRIDGGDFMMGSETGQPDEKPVHSVRVNPFYIGRTEVTLAQWQRFIDDTGYVTLAEKGHGGLVRTKKGLEYKRDANWKNSYSIQTDNHPVVLVDWHDADAFCKWLSNKTGLSYRLPTEAEWEFACRGGTTGDYYADLDSIAWYEYNSNGSSHPVGEKQPNAYGLYDMLGNVWEWCRDRYDKDFYSSGPAIDPKGPGAGKQRINRGGSWCSKPHRVRVSFRKHNPPGFRFYRLGFRVARSA